MKFFKGKQPKSTVYLPRRDDIVRYLMRLAGFAKFENDDFHGKTFGDMADDVIAMVVGGTAVEETAAAKKWTAGKEAEELAEAIHEKRDLLPPCIDNLDEDHDAWCWDAARIVVGLDWLSPAQVEALSAEWEAAAQLVVAKEREDFEQRLEVADTAIALNASLGAEVERLTEEVRKAVSAMNQEILRADKAEMLIKAIEIPNDPGLPTESTLHLIEDLLDPDACDFDHNHSCQAHGYFYLKPGEKCPNQAAKDLLAEHNFQRTDIEDGVKYGEAGGENEPE